ncbi:unnamed protein product, partial [Prorocentrum cordatum]
IEACEVSARVGLPRPPAMAPCRVKNGVRRAPRELRPSRPCAPSTSDSSRRPGRPLVAPDRPRRWSRPTRPETRASLKSKEAPREPALEGSALHGSRRPAEARCGTAARAGGAEARASARGPESAEQDGRLGQGVAATHGVRALAAYDQKAQRWSYVMWTFFGVVWFSFMLADAFDDNAGVTVLHRWVWRLDVACMLGCCFMAMSMGSAEHRAAEERSARE